MLNRQGELNSRLLGRSIQTVCPLGNDDQKLLDHSVSAMGISARGFFKILRVARTIADLDNETNIHTNHLIEALGYRKLDRQK